MSRKLTPGPFVPFHPPEPASDTIPTSLSDRYLSDEEARERAGSSRAQALLEFATTLPVDQGEFPLLQSASSRLMGIFARVRIAIAAKIARAGGQSETYVVDGSPAGLRCVAAVPSFFPPNYTQVLIPLPGRGDAALHVGVPVGDVLDGDEVADLQRVAQIVGRALDLARAYDVAQIAESEVQVLRAQIIQAQKLASLGEIAAGLVHELNNPLTSVIAYTEYLERRWQAKGADPDDLERLARISESTSRLLHLTRDLVSYARVPSERLLPVPMHPVIDRSISFCEHVISGANAVVNRTYADGDLTVLGLPEQLTQVFVNLVTNACHALSEGGGTILIRTEALPTSVKILVADSGSGIPAEHLQRVFVPFFTTKDSGKGSGLGLAIVKNIVEGHRGEIIATSGDPLPGACFTVVLPR